MTFVPKPLLRGLIYFCFCSLLCGCDSVDGNPDGGAPMEPDSGTTTDAFRLGMEKSTDSGQFIVRLVDAQPAPPDEGENVWTLEIENQEGALQSSLAGSLTPWMPEHGHGTNPASYDLVLQDDDTTYKVGPFTLTMPGIWELRIHFSAPQEDNVVFTFRAEG